MSNSQSQRDEARRSFERGRLVAPPRRPALDVRAALAKTWCSVVLALTTPRSNERLAALALLLIFLSGCGKNGEEQRSSVPAETNSESIATKTIDPATVGVIQGSVRYEGPAPQVRMISVRGNPECAVQHEGGTIPSEELLVNNGGLQNVFVYVKEGLRDYSFTAPQEPVVISNKKCVYFPHVSGAMVGQPIQFLNEDSTLHNVHGYPKSSKAFNLGLPLVGMKQTKKIDTAEVMIPLKCDVHPWMLGYLNVVTHPFFGVTDAEGHFELKGLPPGEYTVEAWHEKLGARSLVVRIEPQETKSAEFSFSAASV